MTNLIKKTGLWLFIFVLTSFAAYQAALRVTPYVTMEIAADKLFADHDTNRILHAPVITHHSRQVVRPSPDLLYSICGFDLSAGPLHISLPPVSNNYWSISAYADNTDNFWVMNDFNSQAVKRLIFLGTAEQVARLDPREAKHAIAAPSETGIILFRHLLALPEDFDRVDQIRRQGNCSPID
ncbi:MAG: DUF1254 domain-containing protein [Sneathiella sp.]